MRFPLPGDIARVCLFVAVNAVCAGTWAMDETLLGFDASSSLAQRALEVRFDADIDPKEMDEWLRKLSELPHHSGSEAQMKNAEWIAKKFRSWGYETEIVEYQVLLPFPRTRELELLEPVQFTATLTEDTLEEDPSTGRREHLLPPFNAFSTDGEAEGELVFVNYGRPEDYEILERNGIDVAGKIAIAKYGNAMRGIKPRVAGEKGAIATLIYSDPADDGYGPGDVYPAGPFKNESGVQRGSVLDITTYPGDILTPGRGATVNAQRLKLSEAETVTKIPVLPISYRDAYPLLAAMGGEVVPPEWRGGLPITYHFGPGPARVRLKVEFNWEMVTIRDVIARMEGSRYPGEWVIRGNHYDAWNHGASDPLSGMVAVLAEAKAVAALAKAGHPPQRTVIYAAWDAEEQGLTGSTEWVEEHAAELKKHTVAYINSDNYGKGFIKIGGSHVLERFFNQIMDEVYDPRMDLTVRERRRAVDMLEGDTDKLRDEARDRGDLRLAPLGSGSDYTPFLQHLGIAAADIRFAGEDQDGSYHTLYDTYEHFIRFKDPGMLYGATLAKVAGRATLRLANAPRLPFEFNGFADNIGLYVDELEELATSQREETEKVNQLVADGIYAAALDPDHSLGPPPVEEPVPYFNFAPLRNALVRLQQAASDFSLAIDAHATTSPEINELLYTSERLLSRDAGLEDRPWYTHMIYAPGFYTGYGVKTFPGVREAIEQREYAKVDPQIEIAAGVLNRMAEWVELLAVEINKPADGEPESDRH